MGRTPVISPAHLAHGTGLLLIITGIFGVGASPEASAQVASQGDPSFSSYSLAARADPMSFEVVDPKAPIFALVGGQVVYGSPTTAQAVVNSFGQSEAFASAPYPGDVAVGAAPLVNGLAAGKAPPLPDYPFFVSSSYPQTPTAEQRQGPYLVAAKSSERSSAADARLGLVTGDPTVMGTEAQAVASQEPDTDALTAVADSAIRGFRIGPLLAIGEVSGHAEMSLVPGASEPARKSAFSIGSMTVLGQKVGFTDKGFQIGPGALPGTDTSALTKALATAGVNLAYVPASETPTSISSAGLAVTYVREVPTHGPVTTTVLLGRVTVAVASEAGTSSDHGIGAGESGMTTASGTASEPIAPPAAPELVDGPADQAVGHGLYQASSGGSQDPAAPTPVPNAELSGTVERSDPVPPISPQPPEQMASGTTLPAGSLRNSSGLYLTLVLAGAGLLAGSWFMGTLGVALGLRSRRPRPVASVSAAGLPWQ